MTSKKQRKVPELRFRGFTDDWEQRKLSSIVTRVTRKNTGLVSDLPLTISAQDGLVDQVTYFNKRVASKNMEHYLLLLNGEFAYNKSYSKDYPWGAIKRLDMYPRGALSTLYIAFKPTSVNSEFLVAYYETSNWYKQVSERAAEGARNHGLLNIAPHDFFDTRLLIPKTDDEQRSIGLFIKKLDHTIALHQRKQSLLKKLKQGYLQKLFPQKGQRQPELRFPGFADDWEQRKFSNLVKKVGKHPSVPGDYTAYSVSNVDGLIPQTQQFDGSRLDVLDKSAYKVVNPGEFAYNPARINVGSVAYNDLEFPVLVSSLYVVVRMDQAIDDEFILQFIRSPQFLKEVRRNTEGSVREYLFFDNFKNVRFPFALNIEEQQKVGSFLRTMDDTIALHQQEIDRLQQLKQGYLQKMFV
ncbi:restriction endonuclease subunit S [Schleiferilactobacillus harbinensis]|uniref:restriction endonuclease subunit S n=1 Tax=Schleiferilactobacillus harbinensis TaxID=304207 RepID=UPI0021A8B559|nr:restriction endonuclease subunit S [Schleiferilactobacillus harbinensis]MCT2909816.1 restriction endonuclease subunit S [Schleiferilactobacillus harbinensis]